MHLGIYLCPSGLTPEPPIYEVADSGWRWHNGADISNLASLDRLGAHGLRPDGALGRAGKPAENRHRITGSAEH